MSAIGPERYTFLVYVTYPQNDKNPVLVVYPEIADQNLTLQFASAQAAHLEDAALEGKVIVQRTITEDIFHRYEPTFTISEQVGPSVQAALEYLRKVHGENLTKFFVHCWKLAQAQQQQAFPQKFQA